MGENSLRSRKLGKLILLLAIVINSSVNAYYTIELCMRNVPSSSHGNKVIPIGKHFAMMYCEHDDKNDYLVKVKDSRGYFANNGGTSSKEHPDNEWVCNKINGSMYDCKIRIKKKTQKEADDLWKKVTEVYEIHSNIEYKITTHNCATVADAACKAIGGKGVPLHVNCGCGVLPSYQSFDKNDDLKSGSSNNVSSSVAIGKSNSGDFDPLNLFLDLYI